MTTNSNLRIVLVIISICCIIYVAKKQFSGEHILPKHLITGYVERCYMEQRTQATFYMDVSFFAGSVKKQIAIPVNCDKYNGSQLTRALLHKKVSVILDREFPENSTALINCADFMANNITIPDSLTCLECGEK